MRYWAVLAVLMMALTGCARVVAGTAEPDQHPPGVALGEWIFEGEVRDEAHSAVRRGSRPGAGRPGWP